MSSGGTRPFQHLPYLTTRAFSFIRRPGKACLVTLDVGEDGGSILHGLGVRRFLPLHIPLPFLKKY